MLFLLLTLLLCTLSTETDVTLRCRNEQDCAKFNTYCEGLFGCNSSWRCAQTNKGYNPCAAVQQSANEFTTRHAGEFVMSVVCIESVQACVELYYCMRDSDCQDGLYCNGRERCVDGRCIPASTLTHICSPCDEYLKCGESSTAMTATASEDGNPANPTTVYVTVAVFAVVFTFVVFVLLIKIFQKAGLSRGY